MLLSLPVFAQTKHEHTYSETGKVLTSYPPLIEYKCDKCGNIKNEPTVTIKNSVISGFDNDIVIKGKAVLFEKYALWHKPTKMYVNVRVDSVKLVQRANFNYYVAHCGKMEITMFTKTGDSVKGYLKKRI